MTSDDDKVVTFIPALILLLKNAEDGKGAPLTENEVLTIRDGATCLMMTRSQAEAMDASRGYPDLDPEDAWAQWQVVREQLG